MRRTLRAGVPVYIALVAAGCTELAGEAPATSRRYLPDGGLMGDGINGSGSGAGTGTFTGLPCNVQQVLENRCIACHLAGGKFVPPLLTYDDLLKPSKTEPSKTLAQLGLERMKGLGPPMPPFPAQPASAEEIKTMQAWLDAKTPRGAECTTPDAGSHKFDTPVVCTSNKTWTQGNQKSPNMRPGGACITCHAAQGPAFTIAGTVYPTAHEPNDCNGAPGPLTVVVTDANGVVTNIPVNEVGNFFSTASVVAPFRVKVTNGINERAMAGAATAGDCNSCHTEAGLNGAPGRIVAP
jgi:mono/diheme cytochrome c family protein